VRLHSLYVQLVLINRVLDLTEKLDQKSKFQPWLALIGLIRAE